MNKTNTIKEDKKNSVKKRIVKISNQLRIVKEGENKFQGFNYFRPDDIMIALNPLLKENNLIIHFDLTFSSEKRIYESVLSVDKTEIYRFDIPLYESVLSVIDIDDNETEIYRFDIPLTEVKGTSKAQGAGATLTYAKRYAIMNVFNIADNSADLDSMNHKETEPSQDEVCPKCGSPAKYKEGIKNGKHWQGWFCQKCKNVVWGPKKYDDEAQAEQEESEEIPVLEEDGPSPEQLDEVFGKEN